ncbi:MAG: bifunctional 4-hydroxy-2-oxoglutarate aldolase/2-dehydro-3-deoxy-phosphogluconate aldolase [Bacteroidota bacterium]
MSKKEILNNILREKIVAIIRHPFEVGSIPTALALRNGGIHVIEVTKSTPNVLSSIEELAKEKDIIIGVGSVTDTFFCQEVIAAGAQFVVTPNTKKAVIEVAKSHGKPIFSGAFTPSEIVDAFDYGADVVKLFPAGTLGPSYMRAIRGPLPHIPLMPTGGIQLSNAREWLNQGAVALGIGGSLVNPDWIRRGDFEKIKEQAEAFVSIVKGAEKK